MAASAWTVFDCAKHKLGTGSINFLGGIWRMSLHDSDASTLLSGAITTKASIGNECTGGGYAALTLSGITWTTTTSTGLQEFDFTDPVFTASASALTSVRFAVIYQSAGDIPVAYADLSTASFTVTTNNTLTVQLAAGGAFTLA
jgi:hypothetical protein